jgi:hypothetical protein
VNYPIANWGGIEGANACTFITRIRFAAPRDVTCHPTHDSDEMSYVHTATTAAAWRVMGRGQDFNVVGLEKRPPIIG